MSRGTAQTRRPVARGRAAARAAQENVPPKTVSASSDRGVRGTRRASVRRTPVARDTDSSESPYEESPEREISTSYASSSEDERDVFGAPEAHTRMRLTPAAHALLHPDEGSGRAPDVQGLPGRVDEFDALRAAVGDAIATGQGACVYVSGVPGTGKTATVRQAVRRLRADAPEFDFVEINGMKLGDALQAYNVLWDALSAAAISRECRGRRGRPRKVRRRKNQSAATSLRRLCAFFEARREGRCPCGGAPKLGAECVPIVVLLDEFDQLLAKRAAMMYHFFEWTGWLHSALVVVAVANTMDLPERMLPQRVASRMGTHRLNFRPYTYPQLMEIILFHLRVDAGADGALRVSAGPAQPPVVFRPDALEYCARKVASVSGDARRALSLARRAVALAVLRRRDASDGPVTIALVEQALRLACAGNTVQQIADLSLHEKAMLVAVLLCVRARAAQTSLLPSPSGEDASPRSDAPSFFGAHVASSAGVHPRFGEVCDACAQLLRTAGVAERAPALSALQTCFSALEAAGLAVRPHASSAALPAAPAATAACPVRLCVTEEEMGVALRPLPLFAKFFDA